MKLRETETRGRTQILNRQNKLQCLKRKHGDIIQQYGKLLSYRYEPRTYEQFKQFDQLRESAEQLLLENLRITETLTADQDAITHCDQALNTHIQNFTLFHEETLSYLDSIKLHQTERP